MAEIRTARADELRELLAFERRYTERDATLEAFREAFEAWPELFIVCEDDGEIVGEASGRVDGDEVVLLSIAVEPDYRGDGIGGKILQVFEERARGYAETVSVASADNVEGFYRAFGYEPAKILLQVDEADLPDGDEDATIEYDSEDATAGYDGEDATTGDDAETEYEDAETDYDCGATIVEERIDGSGTTYLYVEFEEYRPALRDALKEQVGAFSANTIYEKSLSE